MPRGFLICSREMVSQGSASGGTGTKRLVLRIYRELKLLPNWNPNWDPASLAGKLLV